MNPSKFRGSANLGLCSVIGGCHLLVQTVTIEDHPFSNHLLNIEEHLEYLAIYIFHQVSILLIHHSTHSIIVIIIILIFLNLATINLCSLFLFLFLFYLHLLIRISPLNDYCSFFFSFHGKSSIHFHLFQSTLYLLLLILLLLLI